MRLSIYLYNFIYHEPFIPLLILFWVFSSYWFVSPSTCQFLPDIQDSGQAPPPPKVVPSPLASPCPQPQVRTPTLHSVPTLLCVDRSDPGHYLVGCSHCMCFCALRSVLVQAYWEFQESSRPDTGPSSKERSPLVAIQHFLLAWKQFICIYSFHFTFKLFVLPGAWKEWRQLNMNCTWESTVIFKVTGANAS